MRTASALLLILGMGCGGSSTPSASAPTQRGPMTPKVTESEPPVVAAAVSRQPIQVQVTANKKGPTVMLEITGIARGHDEGEAFEDATRWTVKAHSGGAELRRVLNGPVKVERIPVGHASGSQWDVFVRFSVAFAIDETASEVEVTVQPPGAGAFRKRYPL